MNYFRIVIIFAHLFFYSACIPLDKSKPIPRAEKGFMNLENWDFQSRMM